MHISTVNGHQRMSTQELLRRISEAVDKGVTEFQIQASGQHDIGGPLWNREGRELRINVSNPGQRVGSMCLPGTKITVEGSAPADVGWLNAGGTVTVRGDAGDTAGHCAAGGKIYIGGRAGTRSGSLLKHDPEREPPELWILKTSGSFSFEFMSGGYAIVCGYDSLTEPSVLGERPCVGMVGGVIYFRGPGPELPNDVIQLPLADEDIAWLDKGLEEYLDHLGMSKLKSELSLWKLWHKIVPAREQKKAAAMLVEQFRRERWINRGIFADIYEDDFQVAPLVASGAHRLNYPAWQNDNAICQDCRACLLACPRNAIKRRETQETQTITYLCNADRCIGCGICAAVCPAGVWQMHHNL